MEHINPYAVMRSTRTFEAYRAYNRAVTKAGQPFLFLALIMYLLTITGFVLAELRRSPPLALGLTVIPICLGGLFMGVAALRMARYRREHPIPDEWRQIPTIKSIGKNRPVA